MVRSGPSSQSGNIYADLGIPEPDVELVKATLAIRIQQVAEQRRLTPDQAAALLNVSKNDLPGLFQGRLATCSLDQLLRMLTWLGDDVEILIRPRLQRTKRGVLRVLQAAAVEKPEDFEPVRLGHGKPAAARNRSIDPDEPGERDMAGVQPEASAGNARQLLNKHAVEKMTSLDITTIYRRMAAGKFPQPVRIGRRRVAWRAVDILQWQQDLEVGTETLRSKTGRSREGNRGPGNRDREDPR